MKKAVRYLSMAVVLAIVIVAGWRIVGRMQAERFAQSQPERALRWRPDHPQALQALDAHRR